MTIKEMAFEPGDAPQLVDPGKKDWIETGDPELDALLPDLSNKEQSYLELITSKTYQEMVKRLEGYTGLSAGEMNLPSLLSIVYQAINQIQQIESSQKRYLENLALDTVLEFPEFKMVKEAYQNDELRFDAKLADAELNVDVHGIENEEAPEGGLTSAEEMNANLGKQLGTVTDEQLQRRMANMLIQGNSILKLFLFNIVKDELEKIDPELPSLYGIVGAVAQLGYFATPFSLEQVALQSGEGQLGSSEVVPKDEIYTIKARGIVFPVLIHEIVKGIYEWLSISPEQKGEIEKEKVGGETKDIIAGPEVTRIVMSYIPTDKQYLTPLIHKKVVALPPNRIKQVLAQGEEGKKIMMHIVQTSQKEWNAYEKEKEEYGEGAETASRYLKDPSDVAVARQLFLQGKAGDTASKNELSSMLKDENDYAIFGRSLGMAESPIKGVIDGLVNEYATPAVTGMDALPDSCFALLPASNQIVRINKGEPGYYPYSHKVSGEVMKADQETVDILNAKLGITPEVADLMTTGSMFGWDRLSIQNYSK